MSVNFEEVKRGILRRESRSAWSKGITAYALELLEQVQERAQDEGRDPKTIEEAEEWALNGARDWCEYSWGGCSLIYNADIATRLCCPSELKRTRNGERRPNGREEWLDAQARALFQAWSRATRAYMAVLNASNKNE